MSAPEDSSRPSVAPAPAGPDDGAGALRAWARNAPVALAAIDSGGLVTWVNPAFERLTGYDAAHARGAAVEPLLADADTPQWLPAPGELARRRLQRHDGVPLHCDAQLDDNGSLRLLTLIPRDVEAEQGAEIHRLGALLDFVQTHARIGLWERNVRTREGRWDPHMFRFFGLDPSRGTPSIAQVTNPACRRTGCSRR